MMKNADCVFKQSWHYNYIFTVSPCHCYDYREFFSDFSNWCAAVEKIKNRFFRRFFRVRVSNRSNFRTYFMQ